jgi:2-hydroxy-3-keto-5-methylthiopentenyl-1-phosphate phosphatase
MKGLPEVSKELDDLREYYSKFVELKGISTEEQDKKMWEWPEKTHGVFLRFIDTPEKWSKAISEAPLLMRNQLKEFLQFVASHPEVILVVVSASFANIISACLSTVLTKPVSSYENIFVFSNALVEAPNEKGRNYKILNVVLTTKKSHVKPRSSS